MNIFFNSYGKCDFNHSTKNEWIEYGFESFCKLLHFLGYPPHEDIKFLKKYFVYEETGPNSTIMKIGDKADSIYYIISGKIKVSTQIENKSVTLGLFTEGNICASITEFFSGSPSAYTFESKSQLRYLQMKKSNFDLVVQQMNKEKAAMVVQKMQQLFLEFVIWHQSYQSMAIDIRVQNLYAKYPEMFNEFTDEDIASFLGIRRETFNRYKKFLFKTL